MQECGEHNVDDLAAGDLTVYEFVAGQAAPLLCVSVVCGHIDRGPPLSAPLGALDQVHLAAGPDLKFDFSLFVFPDFVANL